MDDDYVWVFGYGSLIWDKQGINPVEEKIGKLPGWHRDWTWISKRRNGAPTCSLQPGGEVKGVFWRLNPKTQKSDLEVLRKRELRSSEKVAENVSGIPGKIFFWTMSDNLKKYIDTKRLKGLELYRTLARVAKKNPNKGPDGKTAEQYALAVHEFDPDDEITRMYVDELRKLPESNGQQNPTQVIKIVSRRMESLKANRSFFTALFAVESIILTILLSHPISPGNDLSIPVLLIFVSLVPALLSIFALTDSVHFYSKYLEYNYAWNEKVHGDAYRGKTGEDKAVGDLKRALEADDVGYYYAKLGFLFFLWFLASFAFILPWDSCWRISTFLSLITFFTFLVVTTYKITHRKCFLQAFKNFFIREPVFKDP